MEIESSGLLAALTSVYGLGLLFLVGLLLPRGEFIKTFQRRFFRGIYNFFVDDERLKKKTRKRDLDKD